MRYALMILCITTAWITGAVNAEDATNIGFGANSCELFLVHIDPDRREEDGWDLRSVGYVSWMMGFLAGLNVPESEKLKNEGTSILVDLSDTYDQFARLQEYCAKNPGKQFSRAVSELWLALREEQHKAPDPRFTN